MQCFYRAIFIFQTSMISEGREIPGTYLFPFEHGQQHTVAIVATASFIFVAQRFGQWRSKIREGSSPLSLSPYGQGHLNIHPPGGL